MGFNLKKKKMKSLKILLIGALFMLASNTVSAQKFGVRAGLNVSDINGSGFDTTAKTGLYVGAYKEIPLVKSLLFIQPEVQYSQEGFKTKGLEDTKIDYLTVPILAKVYVAKIVSFETGPQFGFKVSDNVDYADSKSFVPSWAFGASLNFPLGLSINARYISALSDTFDAKNGSDNDFDSGKNQVFQIGAAFQF
jgi:hypothetical protein